VLVGSDALIRVARRWRKVLGGGLRQAGILAAAGLHALDHHVARLAEDHARAARLADALRAIPGAGAVEQHTGMVYVDFPVAHRQALREEMERRRVRVSVGDGGLLRLVLHLDVDDAGVERVVEGFRAARAATA
jgi:threonine aldolase